MLQHLILHSKTIKFALLYTDTEIFTNLTHINVFMPKGLHYLITDVSFTLQLTIFHS